jgi:uncharacterized protein YbjT (DUF2867 family)
MMKYLITGATGDVGSRVVKQLLQRGIQPRVLVRDPARTTSLFGDRVDIATGDLGEPSDLRRAFEGIETVYLVNVGPQIPERDEMAATSAKQKGVKRIVKLSSLDVEHGLAIGAWHEKGEAAIRATGIPYTFVRPTGFMSNLLAWSNSIKLEGVVRSSTGGGHRPFIHSEDIAAVSVEALLDENYQGQCLPLTGPESLTFGQATDIISAAIGKTLNFQAISDEEARDHYSRISGSPEETEAHITLWRAIREDRLAPTTNEVERILGRKAISLQQWALENASSFH